MVNVLATLNQLLHNRQELLLDGTADTPVGHLDNLLVDVFLDDLVVDRDGANFVLDDRKLLAVRLVREDVVQKLQKKIFARALVHGVQ